MGDGGGVASREVKGEARGEPRCEAARDVMLEGGGGGSGDVESKGQSERMPMTSNARGQRARSSDTPNPA